MARQMVATAAGLLEFGGTAPGRSSDADGSPFSIHYLADYPRTRRQLAAWLHQERPDNYTPETALAFIGGRGQICLFDQYSDEPKDVGKLRDDQYKKLVNRNSFNSNCVLWHNNCMGGCSGTMHLFSWTLTPQKQLPQVSRGNTLKNSQTVSFLTSSRRELEKR